MAGKPGVVLAERDRGNWTMNTFDEYDAMHKAQQAAFRASEELWKSIRETTHERGGSA
jgi:hypothetical protein